MTAHSGSICAEPRGAGQARKGREPTVLLHDGRGGVSGLAPNGHFRDTSKVWIDATAFAYAGGYGTTMMFPVGRQLITMRAFAAGEMQIFTASGRRCVHAFATVDVRRGEVLTLSWPSAASVPVLRAGRR